MGQALYRKYRSRSFSDVVGQDHITDTLKKAIETGRISHAYLFTGPRGVGKTSVARILAHEVNQLDYNEDTVHLDIIEIDAASNRRIDEIRELRDKVHISPTSAKYKVYIIDEVHMLTKEAFNALLKTLEEPPAHCIFILATTEAHKLPETIISRTQRFSFKPVEKGTATNYLEKLAKKEKIDIEHEALELLADHGQGSFRDSISLLDQLSAIGRKITLEDVRNMLGLPPTDTVAKIIEQIRDNNNAAILSSLDELYEQGVNPIELSKQLSRQLRTELANGSNEPWIPELLRQLLYVPSNTHPSDSLEICLLEAANKSGFVKNDRLSGGGSGGSEKLTLKSKNPSSKLSETRVLTSKKTEFNIDLWPDVLSYSKEKTASLYTALRLAVPSYSDSTLTLAFEYALHQKKLNQAKQKDLISHIVKDVTGATVSIDCVVDKDQFQAKSETIPKQLLDTQEEHTHLNHLQNISNIFGQAEVLES